MPDWKPLAAALAERWPGYVFAVEADDGHALTERPDDPSASGALDDDAGEDAAQDTGTLSAVEVIPSLGSVEVLRADSALRGQGES